MSQDHRCYLPTRSIRGPCTFACRQVTNLCHSWMTIITNHIAGADQTHCNSPIHVSIYMSRLVLLYRRRVFHFWRDRSLRFLFARFLIWKCSMVSSLYGPSIWRGYWRRLWLVDGKCAGFLSGRFFAVFRWILRGFHRCSTPFRWREKGRGSLFVRLSVLRYSFSNAWLLICQNHFQILLQTLLRFHTHLLPSCYPHQTFSYSPHHFQTSPLMSVAHHPYFYHCPSK